MNEFQGSPSGGHAPDAMLPANKDTSSLQSGEHREAAHTIPSQEDIARLAQQMWEEEGRPENRALDHWSRAEQQLRQQAGLQ